MPWNVSNRKRGIPFSKDNSLPDGSTTTSSATLAPHPSCPSRSGCVCSLRWRRCLGGDHHGPGSPRRHDRYGMSPGLACPSDPPPRRARTWVGNPQPVGCCRRRRGPSRSGISSGWSVAARTERRARWAVGRGERCPRHRFRYVDRGKRWSVEVP